MEDTASKRAEAFFEEGYNCCQSVFLTFAEQYGFDKETACRLAAAFGGGIGRLRGVCGAVSGMSLVCGLESGTPDPKDQEAKAANYENMQKLAAKFKEQSGSLICRELLGLNDIREGNPEGVGKADCDLAEKIGGMGNFKPQARTETYYATRPCKQLVEAAAGIVEEWLKERKDMGN